MNAKHSSRTVSETLGSAHVFASALTELLEEKLIREVSHRRLSFSQLRALQLIAATDRNTVGDIAMFLGVSNAAASKAVDRLARGKWLRRMEAEGDRRSTHLSLTDAARRVLAEYDAARERELQNLFREMSPAEVEQASRMLHRLSTRIVTHVAESGNDCSRCGIYFRDCCLLRGSSDRRCFHKRQTSRKRSIEIPVPALKDRRQNHSPVTESAATGR